MYVLNYLTYRFVNEDGIGYNPVRSQSGPYGAENVFTGPKVRVKNLLIVTIVMLNMYVI